MTRAEYYRAWAAANKDKIAAAGRRYRARHPARVAAASKRWKERSRDKRNAQRRDYRSRNPSKFSAQTLAWRRAALRTREGHARRMYKQALRSGREVSVTEADILAAWPSTDACPVLKTPFVYGINAKADSRAPSLDRIDSAKGYSPDNIAILSWRANAMKRAYTASELCALADWLRSLK